MCLQPLSQELGSQVVLYNCRLEGMCRTTVVIVILIVILMVILIVILIVIAIAIRLQDHGKDHSTCFALSF